MEYRLEQELAQNTPRPVRSSIGAAGLGCMTVFFIPFVYIGCQILIASVRTLVAVIQKGDPHPMEGIFMGAVALFWNGVLGYIFYHATKKARKDYLLARYGTPVPATILSKSVIEQNDSTYCVFSYQFTLVGSSAHKIQGEQKVDKKVGNAIDVGDTLTALYMPQRANRNSLYRFMGFQAKGNKETTYALGRNEEPPPTPIEVTQNLFGNYAIEPELQQPRPRQLERYTRVRNSVSGCAVLFFTPFILVGIYILLLSISLTLVSTVGVSTEAKVVSKDEGSDDDGVKLIYTFQHAGATYQSADKVLYHHYERIKPGDKVNILYLSFFPRGTTLLAEISDTSIGEKWLFTLFWNGFISLFWVIPYLMVRSQQRYVQQGMATPVVITAKTVDRSGENDTYTLHYRYFVNRVETKEGTQKVSIGWWESVSEGDILTLLSLPNAPHKKEFYRFLPYKASLPNKQ